jgi:hypothetical protein
MFCSIFDSNSLMTYLFWSPIKTIAFFGCSWQIDIKIIFVIVFCLFEWKRIHEVFCLSFVYICIAVGVSVFKMGMLGPLYQFDPATLVHLSQARPWMSNVICRGLLCVQVRRNVIVRFADIVGIYNNMHHCTA